MVDTQVLKCRESADGSGHDVVGDQQKCTDDRDDFRTMSDARVDSAAVGIMAADRHVVHPDERHQQTHRCDQPERTVTGDRKSQTDHVRLARAPVPIEDRRRAGCINVARPLRFPNDHILKSVGLSQELPKVSEILRKWMKNPYEPCSPLAGAPSAAQTTQSRLAMDYYSEFRTWRGLKLWEAHKIPDRALKVCPAASKKPTGKKPL